MVSGAVKWMPNLWYLSVVGRWGHRSRKEAEKSGGARCSQPLAPSLKVEFPLQPSLHRPFVAALPVDK